MTTTAPEGAQSELDGVRDEIAALRDLFARRLMDDRARAALYETVQAQVREANDLLRARALESLVLEILLAVDRLQTEPVSTELVESAIDEILEVLARRAVAPVSQGPAFDPAVHEVVATVAADERRPAGTVVALHRVGYQIDGRLLRPARVTVATAGQEPGDAGGVAG